MRYNDWEAFWMKRGKLSFNEMKPFLHNFYTFHEMIVEFFGADLEGLMALEVGAGRGTISHMLTNFKVDVTCLDLIDKRVWDKLPFIKGDVFDLPFDKPEFELVFTYGLLEHFDIEKQVDALSNMLDVTKAGGLNIHYIVPLKLTNLFEDRTVHRDSCFFLRHEYPMIWTYPVHDIGRWRTNKWFGKGAFFKLEKLQHEAIGSCNCKVNKQACTVQKQTAIRKEAVI